MTNRDLQRTLPSAYVLLLLDVTQRFGVGAETLLAPFGLSRETLLAEHDRLPLAVVNDVLIRAVALTQNPALAFHVGMQMKISTHGFIGFAAMTADTVAQALELVERFSELRLLGVQIRHQIVGDRAILEIHTDLTLQPLRDMIIAALMIGFGQMAQVVTGETLYGEADIDIAPLPEYLEINHRLPAAVRFQQPSNRIIFSADYLQLPLLMSDEASKQLAVQQCEMELAAMGHFSAFVRQVRQQLQDADGRFRTLEAVADCLSMSERTLKRQLAQAGTTYSDIVDDLRRKEATQRLVQGDPIEHIAEVLGYSDVANFTRAFKRWTGCTPAQYRREHHPVTR